MKKRTGLFSDGGVILGTSYISKKHRNPVSKIINTNGNLNFTKGRKYDTDMDRLSRRSVQNELSSNQINLDKELEKSRKELKI